MVAHDRFRKRRASHGMDAGGWCSKGLRLSFPPIKSSTPRADTDETLLPRMQTQALTMARGRARTVIASALQDASATTTVGVCSLFLLSCSPSFSRPATAPWASPDTPKAPLARGHSGTVRGPTTGTGARQWPRILPPPPANTAVCGDCRPRCSAPPTSEG